MHELESVQLALHQLRSGELGVHAFSTHVRGHDMLLHRLPRAYREALFDALDRLEASAVFADESGSFSDSGLLDQLQQWIDEARAQLDSTGAPP
jgi:hypothetical protein